MASESQETTASNDMIELDLEYLVQLEEEAKGRYSENDEEFMEHCSKPAPKPPILPAESFQRNRYRGGFRGRNKQRHQDSKHGRYDSDNRSDYKDNRRDFASDGREYRGHKRDWQGERKDYSNDKREFTSDRMGFGSNRKDSRGDRGDYGGNGRNMDEEGRGRRHDQPRSFYYGHSRDEDSHN